MADPYQCLRCTSIGIAIWNLIYCLAQFGLLGWQVNVVKTIQWEYENREMPPMHGLDGMQARFPGLYAIYTETPERRKINALFVIVLLALGCSFLHLLTSTSLLYGVIKRQSNFICVWFFTAAPLLCLTSAYAILWWSGDIFNEQLTFSISEFVMSLAINGPFFLIILMYYMRLNGNLKSDAIGSGKGRRSPFLPDDVPSWYPQMPKDPPFEVKRKIRRRERSRTRSPPKRVASAHPWFSKRSGRSTSRGRSRSTRPDYRRQQQFEPPPPYYNQPQGYPIRQGYPMPVSRDMHRRSPHRVSFNKQTRVYQRTPSSSMSNGPHLEIQTVV